MSRSDRTVLKECLTIRRVRHRVIALRHGLGNLSLYGRSGFGGGYSGNSRIYEYGGSCCRALCRSRLVKQSLISADRSVAWRNIWLHQAPILFSPANLAVSVFG